MFYKMNKLIDRFVVNFYQKFPKSMIEKLGKKKSLKWIRDLLLRSNGEYRIVKTNIIRSYVGVFVEFNFYAPIKIAAKANKNGIENTLLANSINLLKKYKPSTEPVIFDIGANYGYLSLVWGKTVLNNGGKIFSFEPSPTVLKVTKKNIIENKLDNNIKLFSKALGNKNELVKLFLSNTSSNTKKLKHSLAYIEVEMISLDVFCSREKIKKIDLIKIDVDGIEFDILKGAENIIRKHMPILIIETNNDYRIIEFCISCGYEILDQTLLPMKVGQIIPPNVFCVDLISYRKFNQLHIN